ncbi:GGDEF domain-containing protein [Cetobacterium sp.]|uniref:GGDEF domain-containing protein n=1 Tax=Cetobacterium sp. TaxID=2071632 RepID=UPI003F36FDCD
MRNQNYNRFIISFIGLFVIALILFIQINLNRIKQKELAFLKNVKSQNESIKTENLSVLEKEILNKFLSIPENEYPDRFVEIAENNRPLLSVYSEQNVGAHILKKLLYSGKLSNSSKLYILNKLRVFEYKSGNIVDNIKITIEHLNLAEKLDSEYDIIRAKMALSTIISSLNGHETAINILNNINFENKELASANRLKIIHHFYLAENYFFIEDYVKSLNNLELMSNLVKNESEYYKININLLKNLLDAQISLKLNKPNEVLNSLALSEELLKKLEKVYFSDLHTYYFLVLENYNLKYNIDNFNSDKVKKIIGTPEITNDSIFLRMSFDLLFEYYIKTNNFDEYKNLNLDYMLYLRRLSDANNKFFSLYIIQDLENKKFVEENKKLYINIFIILLSGLIILVISFKKIKYLDKKSKTDALTNIGNRLAFSTKINQLSRKNYYMLLFDIDNFKNLNDTYGHDFGDEVLSSVGKILKIIENKELGIYRVGGEEFAIIFTNANKNFAIDSCEYVRKSIENIIFKHPVTVTISGGFSEACKNTYIECDSKLYKAKKDGKNRICY